MELGSDPNNERGSPKKRKGDSPSIELGAVPNYEEAYMQLEKIILMSIIGVLLCQPAAQAKTAFKDASPEVKKAVNDFEKRGIMKKFISKYGSAYFRPTTTITREDLLLTLYEYDMMVKTLMDYRKQFSASLSGIKKRVDAVENQSQQADEGPYDKKLVDEVAKKVQSQMTDIIEKAPISKKIEERISSRDRKIEMIEIGSGTSGKSKNINEAQRERLVRKEVKRVMGKDYKGTDQSSNKSSGRLSKIAISLGLLAAIFLAR